jgi:tetratricopeptide (TPR) repeat protein
MAAKGATKKRTVVAPSSTLNPLPASSLIKFAPLLIVVVGIVAYSNILQAPFIYDDRYHILENPRIRELWPPGQLVGHTSRPVVLLSLALNYALGGLNPLGYHVFNIAVHILAGLVLYGILRRTFNAPVLSSRWHVASSCLAVLIASVWVVHPLETESVTYTIQRGESLMGLFYLLTLYCAIRVPGSPNASWWKCAAVTSCLLGMGSKGGVMITAPLIALLYDRTFVSRSWRELITQRWGFYAALVATWISYPVMLSAAPEEWKESAGFGYGASPLQYAMTQPKVILHYLRLSLWPDQLCLDYGWPLAGGAGEVLPYLLVLAGLIAATAYACRKKPALGFLGAAFFIILIPTSSFIPIADVAVEHRMYLSLAAVITLIVTISFVLIQRPVYLWLAGGLVVILLTAATIHRNGDYSSKLAIWTDAVEKSPHNPRGQYDLGEALEENNNFPEAIAHYRLAIQENPNYADALTNLGHLLVVSGKATDSVPYLRKAIAIKPDLAAAHNNLALAFAEQGNIPEAVAHWEQAIKWKPGFAEPHNNLGIIYAQQGSIQDAVAEWEKALQLDPNLSDAHNNLAYFLSQQGKTAESIDHYQRALAIKPDYFQPAINLAKLLTTADPARAVSLAERACALPGHHDAPCLDVLAGAYAAAKRPDDAMRSTAAAIELARSAGDQQLLKQLESRMEAYRARH